MVWKEVAKGLLSRVPGALEAVGRRTGGTDTARYCYSVWLRHVVMAMKADVWNRPRVVAELGPGDSLGVGLAALLTGAERYLAFDVVKYSNTKRNLAVFEELVSLVRAEAPIPNDDEFPEVRPRLSSYEFPGQLRSSVRTAMTPDRVREIEVCLQDLERSDSVIRYVVPWDEASVTEPATVDMIFSQAVLEHVVDLRSTYRAMSLWLAPGGFMTHQVDFRSHQTAKRWNGHWGYGDLAWRVIQGKREYLLNREPSSTHSQFLDEAGLDVVHQQSERLTSALNRRDLAHRFATLSDTDLTTCGAFFVLKTH